MRFIFAFILGLGTIGGSCYLLWTNEGRAVRTAKGLKEGEKTVIQVDVANILPENEGKLVYITGPISGDLQLTDSDLQIGVEAARMKREVDMYQWKENSYTSEDEKTTYSYEKVWENELLRSDGFHQSTGHENPPEFTYPPLWWHPDNAMIGAFEVNTEYINLMDDWEDLDISDYPETNGNTLVDNKTLFVGKGSATAPAVGDVKISYEIIPAGEFSLIGQQSGNTLVPFTSSKGTSIALLQPGNVPYEEMFEKAKTRNTMLTWVYRALGIFLMFIGSMIAISPLTKLIERIPLAGRIVNKGIGLIGFILAVIFGFIVIAIAWIFYRPLLGISLLLIAGLLIFGGLKWLTDDKYQ